MENWIEKHSVGCYYCEELVDERDCIPADPFNGDDGGDICPRCQKEMKLQDKNEEGLRINATIS